MPCCRLPDWHSCQALRPDWQRLRVMLHLNLKHLYVDSIRMCLFNNHQ